MEDRQGGRRCPGRTQRSRLPQQINGRKHAYGDERARTECQEHEYLSGHGSLAAGAGPR